MKFKIAIVSLILSFISYSISICQVDPRLKGIETEMEEILETWKGAGFAVGVVVKDKVVYAEGFGYKNVEDKEPVSANTLFAIGSSSKAFTSGLLGILRNEGKVDFDDNPKKYIPELRFFNDYLDQNITIKDAMCHRTGLPRHDISWFLFPTESKIELLKRVEFQEPTFDLRKQWQYNNFMFLMQGVIAEKITEKTWEENITEKFFKPLGMNTSNTSIDELLASEDYAYGYTVRGDTAIEKMDYYHIRGMAPAGSINSSVNEMGNWLKLWINGGKYNDEEILPASYVSEAITPQMVITGGLPDGKKPDLHFATYGYGWMMSSYKGHYRVQHGGNINGFSANACFFPSDSIGIVVLANQNGSSIPAIVRNTIADRMLGLDFFDWNKDLFDSREEANKKQKEAEENVISNKKEDTNPSHMLTDYAGTYNHPGYGEIILCVSNDSLLGKVPDLSLYFKHYHYDVFEIFEIKEGKPEEIGGLKVNFTSNDAGEIDGAMMSIQGGLDPLKFERKPAEVEMDAASLEQYVGEYELGGMVARFYTKVDGDILFLTVPGQPEYELAATGEDKFTLKSLSGFNVEFEKDEDGKVTSVVFFQPNGTFKASRK